MNSFIERVRREFPVEETGGKASQLNFLFQQLAEAEEAGGPADVQRCLSTMSTEVRRTLAGIASDFPEIRIPFLERLQEIFRRVSNTRKFRELLSTIAKEGGNIKFGEELKAAGAALHPPVVAELVTEPESVYINYA